jgi:preprotein translocase subunit SecA
MDFLQKIGDFFTAFLGAFERLITKCFGSSNERRVKAIGFDRDKEGNSAIVEDSVLDKINKFEPTFEKLSDDELKQSAVKFRERLSKGETLDDLLPEAFAVVREAGKRFLKMRHYDVQMVGGYVLHKAMIAEMTTGEGKTLVATLPTFLNALVGKVHVVTVNDYLARRDMEWMAALYIGLGLTVGAIQAQMDPYERQEHYACDVTYGTNNEFGFDYLRDNMKPTKDRQVQGPLAMALVDEIDNILIDEARTPLIISGPAHDDITKYRKANQIAVQLKKDVHFELKEKEHTCHMTDDGVRHAEKLAGVESFYTQGNMHWPHLIDNSLKAHHLYKNDVQYVIEEGDVVIIDEFTGRKMVGRQWSDGLHQAVEAKEGVKIKEESQTLATITLQNYFKLYKKLAGMTGTAMTEADEFLKIYKLDVISVPTNMPMKRLAYTDMIYRSEREKWDAVVEEIRDSHDKGRPVLVGTVSIEKSETISKKLKKYGIQHSLLNAKVHEREAEIIAQAGRKGAVTISTNMAGRGTDIVLGGNPEYLAWDELSKTYASRLDVPKLAWDEATERIAQKEGMVVEGREVAQLGGLHVVGTERHDSRRIDLQLRGRAGRQGDPGSSRFFVSLDDDLMRLFMPEWVRGMLTTLGMKEGEAIESKMVTRQLESAQKKREEGHFETRKHLLEYDEVMDDQRKGMYSYRQRILDGGNCRDLVLSMIDRQVDRWTEHFLESDYRWNTVTEWCDQVLHVDVDPDNIRDMTLDQVSNYIREEARHQAEDEIQEHIEVHLSDEEDEVDWNWQAMSNWSNTQYNLNTNDRELKKIGRENLFMDIYRRACEAVDRYDLESVSVFIQDDWGAQSLSSWLHQQYTMKLSTEEIFGKELVDAIDFIKQRVRKMYHEKEVRFPVAVGLAKFLSKSQSGSTNDREGLARWASSRFATEIEIEEFRTRSIADIERQLVEGSESFLAQGKAIDQIDDQLDGPYGELNGVDPNQMKVLAPDRLPEIVKWAKENLRAELDIEELTDLDRDFAKQRVLFAYDSIYRPELQQAERSVILEIIDTAWKDHLYFMDHLRSSVSLAGYAQKDPKVEYRRGGMKAYQEMWDRIGQNVTGAIFRLESESQEFVGSLWQISEAGKAAEVTPTPAEQPASPRRERSSGRESGPPVETVAPIRNRGPKVGRNAACPCGSGKKYKKCCGSV